MLLLINLANKFLSLSLSSVRRPCSLAARAHQISLFIFSTLSVDTIMLVRMRDVAVVVCVADFTHLSVSVCRRRRRVLYVSTTRRKPLRTTVVHSFIALRRARYIVTSSANYSRHSTVWVLRQLTIPRRTARTYKAVLCLSLNYERVVAITLLIGDMELTRHLPPTDWYSTCGVE